MIELNLNGKRTQLTGWKAWLVGAIAVIPIALFLGLVLFVLIGFTVTVGAMLMLLVPAILIVGIVASLMPKKRPD